MSIWLLQDHDKNYHTHDLKLAILVFALKIWWHYLYSETYEIYTTTRA